MSETKIAEKTDPNSHVEEKKPKPSGKEKCCNFFYNKKAGTVLGRNGGSWARIGIFYLFFYFFLLTFFFAFLFIMLAFLNTSKPYHMGSESLITRTSIGLSVSPGPEKADSSFVAIGSNTMPSMVTNMKKFLEKFNNAASTPCTFSSNTLCQDKIETGPDCSAAQSFGYGSGSPCFAVRLNKIIGWKPVSVFKKGTNTVPKLQTELGTNKIQRIFDGAARDEIENIATALSPSEIEGFLSSVWIRCDGETPADKRHLAGGIKHRPFAGIPHYYFPFNTKDYKAPFVMIQVINPTPNVPISISCKAFADNIEQDETAGIQFQFMVV